MLTALTLLCGTALGYNVRTIINADEFIQLSNDVKNGNTYNGTTIFLGSDIDFSGKTFEPIGPNKNTPFLGTFDGQNHIISNLEMDVTSTSAGLFGHSTGTTIKNVILDSTCKFFITKPSGNTYFGGIIGYCGSKNSTCIIENCVNMASVFINCEKCTTLYAGGVAGFLYSFNDNIVSMKNCANYGTIQIDKSNHSVYTGGVVGHFSSHINHTIYLQNSVNYGSITINYESLYIYTGGISGYIQYTTMENCVSGGKISMLNKDAANYAGSLVGTVYSNSIIKNCIWTSDVGFSDPNGQGNPTVKNSYLSLVNKTTVEFLNAFSSTNNWNKWILNSKSSKIKFIINNGKSFTLSNQLILLPDANIFSILVFDGWFTDSFCTEKFDLSAIEKDTTLYALYGYIVSVVFNGTGGTVSKHLKSVSCYNPYGDLPTAKRDNNKFLWWYRLDQDNPIIVKEDSKVVVPRLHYIYAAWEINTVTFLLNSDDDDESTVIDSYTVKYNQDITYPKNPKRKGYKFAGWDKNIVNTQGMDVVIKAMWNENNGGNGGAIAAGILVPLFVIVVCVIVYVVYKRRHANPYQYTLTDEAAENAKL